MGGNKELTDICSLIAEQISVGAHCRLCFRTGCRQDGKTGVKCRAGFLPESHLQGGEDSEEQQKIHNVGCPEEWSAFHEQVCLSVSRS